MTPYLIGGSIIVALGLGGWALLERGNRIAAQAEAAQFRAADDINKKTIATLRLNTARDTIRTAELENELTTLRERQRARTEAIAAAADSDTCGPAMRALYDSLWREDPADRLDVRREGTPR